MMRKLMSADDDVQRILEQLVMKQRLMQQLKTEIMKDVNDDKVNCQEMLHQNNEPSVNSCLE